MRTPPGSISGVGNVSSASGFPGWSKTAVNPLGTSEPPLIDGQSEPIAADKLVVRQAPLQVLRDHVDVLEVPLDQVAVVGRGCARGVVDGVDDLRGQPNAVRGRDPQRGAVLE